MLLRARDQRLLSAALLALWLTSAGCRAPELAHPPELGAALDQLRCERGALDLELPVPPSPELTTYLDHYGLQFTDTEHHFGFFEVLGQSLAAHVFRPRAARGTVFLMHGYYDHAGLLGELIGQLLIEGYAVAVYDQPGHGLSSGQPAWIDDFSTYTLVLTEFLARFHAQLPPPYHIVAHSMGAAVVTDALLSDMTLDFATVVLVAPLVRSRHWTSSRLGAALANPFVDSVPRVFRASSSDQAYLEFVRSDPLQAHAVPLDWFEALVEWSAEIEERPAYLRPVKILQGTADVIVDWRYNLELLARKFPGVEINLLTGARHQLLNEAPAIRQRVFARIGELLESSPVTGPLEH